MPASDATTPSASRSKPAATSTGTPAESAAATGISQGRSLDLKEKSSCNSRRTSRDSLLSLRSGAGTLPAYVFGSNLRLVPFMQ